jgi:hypothetical protein
MNGLSFASSSPIHYYCQISHASRSLFISIEVLVLVLAFVTQHVCVVCRVCSESSPSLHHHHYRSMVEVEIRPLANNHSAVLLRCERDDTIQSIMQQYIARVYTIFFNDIYILYSPTLIKVDG